MSRRWFGSLVALVSFGLAGCASDWQERYEQSQREQLDLVAQMDELRTAQATDAARAESIAAQQKAMEREQAKLLAERNDAATRAREWQGKYEQLAAAPKAEPAPAAPARTIADDAAARFEKDFPGRVTVTPDGNVEITLSSDVTFAPGSDQLSDAAKKSLRSLAGKLNAEFPTAMVRIEGHTDNTPVVRTKEKFHDNLGLSTARANSVTRFMQDELRIEANRLMSAGRGDQEPIADNKSPAGRAKNRRVEIVVVMNAAAK